MGGYNNRHDLDLYFRPMIPADEELLKLAVIGDKQALGSLLSRYQTKLLSLIAARIDLRIISRVDALNILQEVHLEVERRRPEYRSKPDLSFYNWTRFLAKQKLAENVRCHVFTQARDVRREVPLPSDPSEVMSVLLLRHVERPRTADASIRLGISPNTCRQRHIRALTKLRTLLIESDLSWSDL